MIKTYFKEVMKRKETQAFVLEQSDILIFLNHHDMVTISGEEYTVQCNDFNVTENINTIWVEKFR